MIRVGFLILLLTMTDFDSVDRHIEIETVQLTADEIEIVDTIFSTICEDNHVDKIGGESADAGCCRRLRVKYWNNDYQFQCVKDCFLKPHVVAYLQKYKAVRIGKYHADPNKFTLSHLCGESLCIEPTHIRYEPLFWNLNRKICHCMIRDWISEQRRNTRINITGTMTIARMQDQQRTLGLDVQCWQCYHDWFGGSKCFVNVGWPSRKRSRKDAFSGTEWNASNLRRSKRIRNK